MRIVDSSKFKISTTIAAAIVTVHPGGIRELHWHPNADEWQYYISGAGRMTVFATGGRARTMDFQAGDVGYVQKTLPHYVAEHRQHRPQVPGNVQEQFLSGPGALGMAHAYATGTGDGPSGHRPSHARRHAER